MPKYFFWQNLELKLRYLLTDNTLLDFTSLTPSQIRFFRSKKDVQLDHNYDVRSKTNEKNTNHGLLLKIDAKKFTDHLICFLIAEQFPIQSYSNWLMKRQD